MERAWTVIVLKSRCDSVCINGSSLDPTKEAIIMVGDRNHDILGAQQNGLDSIGVLYGFGEETELQEAGATFLVQSPKDLGAILLQNS